ncbi:MAG: LD-carboxypeptidase [Ferruginibacter sp.]
MNRKKFLASIAAASVPLLGIPQIKDGSVEISLPEEMSGLIPSYLKPGDTIGITCPAGYITLEDVQPGIQVIESWGYKIKMGTTVGKRDNTFGGTDEERTKDFQDMLDDKTVKAILCARGGYGMVRIIDGINFTEFRKKPKWIIGFSDVTVVHCHLDKWKIPSLHSKMLNSFPKEWSAAEPIQVETILSIKAALAGEKTSLVVQPSPYNRNGIARGILVGGNLSIIYNMVGTPSDINTNGKILFIEDVSEYYYSIDRMLWNLKRSGKLKNLAGLIVGGFNRLKNDEGEEFGHDHYDMVTNLVKEYKYPVCFDFPVGHQKNNYSLKCGMPHQLSVDKDQTILKEI